MEGSPSKLREHFGDKPPDITRKITACVACRKQKIKCHMRESQPPCTRCKKRGLSCTVNKSLQMLLDSDSVWKERIDRKIRSLETAIGKISDHVSLANLLEVNDTPEAEDIDFADGPSYSSAVTPQAPKHTPANFEINFDENSGPAAIPGSVVSPVSVPGFEQNRADQDIITKHLIGVEQAQSFLDVYQNRLDHFLYRIIGDRRTLGQVRAGSPLLLAAICAVGALHVASPQYEKCYQEFVTIAAAQMFSKQNTIDDIRGLCIGAFWLSGISWTCIGAAVRMSTEMGLHRSIFKALTGDKTHYLRTRLYYLVWVCDHHCSIAYGRPPMTHQDDAIRAMSRFLETENAVDDDWRLGSQVQFWTVASEIYETFGVDVERPLDHQMIEPLRNYSTRLDDIRSEWTERLSYNQYVGNYPRKGVGLHYHFSKLYLLSLAFRGIGKPGFKTPDIALDIDELANSALLSATAILTAVVSDTEIQAFLNGLPTYFDVMIAFAVVFMLKVSTKYASSIRVDTSEIRSLVAHLVEVLKQVTATMHSRHLLVSVARGADSLLQKCCPPEMLGPVPANAHVTLSHPTFDDGLYDTPSAWNGTSLDNFYMGEFDFLSDFQQDHFQQDLQYQAMPRI